MVRGQEVGPGFTPSGKARQQHKSSQLNITFKPIAQMNVDMSCPRCTLVHDAMQEWRDFSLKVDLGTFGDLERSTACQTCQAIALYFKTKKDFEYAAEIPTTSTLSFGGNVTFQRFRTELVRAESRSSASQQLTCVDVWRCRV
jgi:hypothetical protein